jgi:DNA-binding CsgD family transcriptional regulator
LEFLMAWKTEEPIESTLERAFDTHFIALGTDLPRPEKQYEFYKPHRNWRFDRAWPDEKVAVELEGGVYGQEISCHNCGATVRALKKDGTPGKTLRISAGHRSFQRFLRDQEKYNTAEIEGWVVLRFVHDDVYGDPFSMVETIREALTKRRNFQGYADELTDRDKDVLRLIAAGFITSEIAERLSPVSTHTIRGYVRSICEKLFVCTRSAAVAKALGWGLIDFEEIPFPDEILFDDED